MLGISLESGGGEKVSDVSRVSVSVAADTSPKDKRFCPTLKLFG